MSDDIGGSAYPSLLHSTSLSRRQLDGLPLDTEMEGSSSIYAPSYPFEGDCRQVQPQAHTLTLETNTNPSSNHHPTLSLPPASFSLPASTSARTRPTPAAKTTKSTTKKARLGAASDRMHDLGGRMKEGRGDVDEGGGCGGGAGPGPRMKRGPRGKFVSSATNTKDELVAGSSSGLSSLPGSTMGPDGAVEVGVVVDRRQGGNERVSDHELRQTSCSQRSDAPPQASYTSLVEWGQDRSEDLTLTAGVRVISGVGSGSSGRKSREKAFRCPVRVFPFDPFFLSFFFVCVPQNAEWSDFSARLVGCCSSCRGQLSS